MARLEPYICEARQMGRMCARLRGVSHTRMYRKLAALIVLVSLSSRGLAQANTNFLAAADFSFLSYFESLGVKYKDGGQVQDAFQILKNHGVNCVRLRLFTSSQAQAASNPYNYINNTNYTVPLAARVKAAELSFLLD